MFNLENYLSVSLESIRNILGIISFAKKNFFNKFDNFFLKLIMSL